MDEHNRLEAAASALAKLGASAPAATAAAATTTTAAATTRRRPGRPRGGAKRASKAAPAASPAATPTATPVKARRKKPGRPKAAARAPLRRSRPCRDSPESRSPNWPPRWGSRRPTSTACCLGWSRRGRWRRRGGGGFRGRGEEAPLRPPRACRPRTPGGVQNAAVSRFRAVARASSTGPSVSLRVMPHTPRSVQPR